MLRSILMIDDSEADLYLMKRIVDKSGLCKEVFFANDGEEALRFFSEQEELRENHPPQVVFLDINMPILNGWEFLEEYQKLTLKNKALLKSTSIIMLSSSQLPEEKERALKYSFVKDYFVKPFSKTDLDKLIQNHFS